MAKQSGLGDNFYVGGRDLSGDTNAISEIGGSVALLDVTGINKSAYERIGGLRDGRAEWVSHFNPVLGGTHKYLSTLPNTDVMVTYARGTTLGNPAACMIAKQINYDPTRADDGRLTIAVQAQANGFGLQWGQQLTAGLRTDTVATSPATGIDTTAPLSFGGQAFMQCTAFTGTSVTIKVQDSADNSTFADVTGLTFTAVTAANTTERLATANNATIRRYIRVITTGTFSNAVFNVVIVKNELAGQTF